MTPQTHSGVRESALARTKPLTDPADLITLLGRFMACGVLFILTVVALCMRYFTLGIGMALFSLFWQRATLKMYRRLRDERAAAEADRAADVPGAAGLGARET
jgi:hypothetical protein